MSAAASLFSRGLAILTTLLSVPLTISYLGPERYGLWLTVSSVLSMMRFADLGIGNGLLTEVARAKGLEDESQVRSLVSSAFLALSGVALLLCVVCSWLIPWLDWSGLFGVTTPEVQAETRPVMTALFVVFVLGIPATIAERVQMGSQEGYVATGWNAAGSLLSLVGLIVVTQLRLGLIPLVVCLSGGPTFARVSNTLWYFWTSGSQYRPHWSKLDIQQASKLVKMGALFVVLSASASFAFLSDNLVLANRFGADQVPILAVPAKLFNFLLIPIQLMATPLWPAFGEALSRGDLPWVKRTLRRSTGVAMIFTAVAGSLLVLLGDPLVRVWTRGEVGADYTILVPLWISTVLMAWGINVASFLNGGGRLKEQALSAAIMAPTAFALKWLLADSIGIWGIPWATVIAYFLLTYLPLSLVIRSAISQMKNDSAAPPPQTPHGGTA